MSKFLNRIPLFKERKCHIDLQVQKIAANPPEFISPFLKVDKVHDDTWYGNVLLVHQKHLHSTLCLEGSEDRVTILSRKKITELYGFVFTRWDVSIKQNECNTRQNYNIVFQNKGPHH